MIEKEVRKLGPGLYRIFWKTGGVSLAAVGVTEDGKLWMAPTNWVTLLDRADYRKTWAMVERVELITER